MRLLLDTHVLLWHLGSPETLSGEFLTEVARATDVVVSVASLWEIALKMSKGKIVVPDDLPEIVRAAGLRLLPVSLDHAWRARHAPASLATADPFDRMLYVQAIAENLTLATRDRALLASGVAALAA